MRDSYEEMLEPVMDRLGQLSAWRALHLTSIAKAVEKASGFTYRILLQDVPHSELREMWPAMLVNQELLMYEEGDDRPLFLRENIILFSDDLSAEHARFATAHELAHAYLHQPHEREERVYITFPGKKEGKQVFAIQYSEADEMQADLFAAILSEQRPAPKGREDFRAPCLREVVRLSSYFNSGLAGILPEVPWFCSHGM